MSLLFPTAPQPFRPFWSVAWWLSLLLSLLLASQILVVSGDGGPSPDQAVDLAPGDVQGGFIASPFEIQFWAVAVCGLGQLKVTVNSIRGNANAQLYDSNAIMRSFSYESSEALDVLFYSNRAEEVTAVTVAVLSAKDSAQYSIRAELTACPEEKDNTAATIDSSSGGSSNNTTLPEPCGVVDEDQSLQIAIGSVLASLTFIQAIVLAVMCKRKRSDSTVFPSIEGMKDAVSSELMAATEEARGSLAATVDTLGSDMKGAIRQTTTQAIHHAEKAATSVANKISDTLHSAATDVLRDVERKINNAGDALNATIKETVSSATSTAFASFEDVRSGFESGVRAAVADSQNSVENRLLALSNILQRDIRTAVTEAAAARGDHANIDLDIDKHVARITAVLESARDDLKVQLQSASETTLTKATSKLTEARAEIDTRLRSGVGAALKEAETAIHKTRRAFTRSMNKATSEAKDSLEGELSFGEDLKDTLMTATATALAMVEEHIENATQMLEGGLQHAKGQVQSELSRFLPPFATNRLFQAAIAETGFRASGNGNAEEMRGDEEGQDVEKQGRGSRSTLAAMFVQRDMPSQSDSRDNEDKANRDGDKAGTTSREADGEQLERVLLPNAAE